MIEYKSYDYTRTIPVDDYILRYRDERRFMAYCRECRRSVSYTHLTLPTNSLV